MTDYQSYTDSKLRYADIYLQILESIERKGGSDLEKAHMESFIYHLNSAFDILLQECNLFYPLGLSESEVSLNSVLRKLDKKAHTDGFIEQLKTLNGESESWFRQLRELRNKRTHRRSSTYSYYLGGKRDGKVYMLDLIESYGETDYVKVFTIWINEMKELVMNFRSPGT